MHFARSLPLAKALDPDTLLALHMNGEPLRAAARLPGAPVRARLVRRRLGEVAAPDRVVDATVRGILTRARSTRTSGARSAGVEPEDHRPDDRQVGDHPAAALATCSGRAVTASSASPGPARIELAAVEVSTDGGATLGPGRRCSAPTHQYSWSLWEYPWEVDPPRNDYTLLVAGRLGRRPDTAAATTTRSAAATASISAGRSPCALRVRRRRPRGTQRFGHAPLRHERLRRGEQPRPLDMDLEFMAGEGI